MQELAKVKSGYKDSPGSNIETSFAFSRLYVTLTRAKDNLHFIENEEWPRVLEEANNWH